MRRKEKNPTADACTQKLCDNAWEAKIAEYVAKKHRKKKQEHALWVALAVCALSVGLLTSLSMREAEQKAQMFAYLDQATSVGFESVFFEE